MLQTELCILISQLKKKICIYKVNPSMIFDCIEIFIGIYGILPKVSATLTLKYMTIFKVSYLY